MASNFIIHQTTKDNDAILYLKYKYYYKRTNKDHSISYVCSFKDCSSSVTVLNGIFNTLNNL